MEIEEPIVVQFIAAKIVYTTPFEAIPNLKPFRIKIILKRILLKDEQRIFKMILVLRLLIQIRFIYNLLIVDYDVTAQYVSLVPG